MSREIDLKDGIYFKDPKGYHINIHPTKKGIRIFVQDTDYDTFKISREAVNSIKLKVYPDFEDLNFKSKRAQL